MFLKNGMYLIKMGQQVIGTLNHTLSSQDSYQVKTMRVQWQWNVQ